MSPEQLGRFLKKLTYREREVVRLRQGLGYDCTYSLEEVARIFKVSRERIRQIQAKALAKLQKFRAAEAKREDRGEA